MDTFDDPRWEIVNNRVIQRGDLRIVSSHEIVDTKGNHGYRAYQLTRFPVKNNELLSSGLFPTLEIALDYTNAIIEGTTPSEWAWNEETEQYLRVKS